MTLADRAILITGATSGVGRALAHAAAARGAYVLVHGRDPDRLAAVAADVGGAPLAADLAAPDGPEQLAAAARHAHPDLSVLINNAAVQHNYLFHERPGSDAAADAAYEVHVDLTAPIQLTARLLSGLRDEATRTGRPSAVVNVTSGLALAPKKTAPVYCAAKAGLRTFSKALRYQAEDEAAGGGPRLLIVDAVLPLVDTPMTAGRASQTTKIPPEQAAREILGGLEREQDEVRVGKARAFVVLHRWLPALAERMLREG